MKSLIEPQIGFLKDHTNQAEAYRVLGKAEEIQGRYRFAALYYQKMYNIETNAVNLYVLAKAYENSGQWSKAYGCYNELLNNFAKDVDIPYLKSQIDRVAKTCLCTPEPSHQLFP